MEEYELSEEIIDQIEDLSGEGSDLFEDEEYEQAITLWKTALALIPQPQNNYSETLWLETSIGDAYYMMEDQKTAHEHFLRAKSNISENPYESPFLMMRLGQSYLDHNNTEEAIQYLLRAYAMEGEDIFEYEDEKYLKFLGENVDL